MKLQKTLMYLIILLLPLVIYLAYDFSQKQSTISTVNNVVSQYIEYSSTMQWENAQRLLTGEALAQTIKNQDTASNKEKILSTKFHTTINGTLAAVDADIEKSGQYDDRQSYTFHLVKNAGEWKIYKVEYKDFTRPVLSAKKGHSAAKNVLNEYLSLDIGQRTKNAEDYLAGNLLRATLINRPLQQGQQINELKEKIISITPVGATEGIATYEVIIETESNETVSTTTILADLCRVNGRWKIINIDLIRVG